MLLWFKLCLAEVKKAPQGWHPVGLEPPFFQGLMIWEGNDGP